MIPAEMRAKIIDAITNNEAPKDPAPREITPAQPKLPNPVARTAVGKTVDGRGIAPNKVAPPSIGKMLKAIADGYQDKATIASVAGISPTSSGLGSGLRELVDLELIVLEDGRYKLTEGL